MADGIHYLPGRHRREFKVFLPFCGIGVGGLGFLDARPELDGVAGRWRCVGGVDSDAGAIANASRLLGTPCTVMDLFSREQYHDFHGHEPPAGWREATPEDIRRAAGYERPDLVFTSPPCKGYSGLLGQKASATDKYQALNGLALRGVWLTLEAWKDEPPAFFLLENVPRMATRGRGFLDQITAILRSYGYAVAETVHDCGHLGNLAQSRKRFLLVARHQGAVPNHLYQPPARPLRGVGEVLSRLPLPGAEGLHRLPNLHWKTWVRLALVEAGSDWRSLNRLRVENGVLADYGIVPDRAYHAGAFGVQHWHEHAGTMTGNAGRPSCGTFSVADPRMPASASRQSGFYRVVRFDGQASAVTGAAHVAGTAQSVADPRYPAKGSYGQYGILRFEETAGAVSGQSKPGGGFYSVADPRHPGPAFAKYQCAEWNGPARTVIAGNTTGQGAYAVCDPRLPWRADAHQNKFRVTGWARPAGAAIGTNKGPGSGMLSVADPRPAAWARGKSEYVTGGHYGLVHWRQNAYAVTGSGQYDNGHNSVADPRLPAPDENLACVIVSDDGTWHRPFTTLEVAALQAIFDPEEHAAFALRGGSDMTYREWIGNAVPRAAARAIAEQFGHALLLAATEQTFILTPSSSPVWVRPLVAALQCGASA